jgi:hypothetical protein
MAVTGNVVRVAVEAAFAGGLVSAEFGGAGTAEVARAIADRIPG